MFLVLLLAIAPQAALAHRLHAGLTTITLSADQQEIQITHRLFAHDLEQVLFRALSHGWQEDQASIDFVGAYTQDHFALALDKKLLQTKYIGAEAEAEFIYVYFTAPMPEKPKSAIIWNTILTDQFPDQINLNNLSFGPTVLSATLTASNTTKTLALAPW